MARITARALSILVVLATFFSFPVQAEEEQYGLFITYAKFSLYYKDSSNQWAESASFTNGDLGSFQPSSPDEYIPVLADNARFTVVAMEFMDPMESYFTSELSNTLQTRWLSNGDWHTDAYWDDPFEPIGLGVNKVGRMYQLEKKDSYWQTPPEIKDKWIAQEIRPDRAYGVRFTVELLECNGNCPAPPSDLTCTDVMQDIPEAPIKVDSDIWLNVGLQDRTRCVPVQGLYCQYNIDTSLPAACDGTSCHTTAIATGGDQCNPAPKGELGDSSAVPPTQSPADMGGVENDGAACTPTQTAMGTFCLGGEVPPEDCVTGPNGQVCDGDAPTVELPDGSVVPLPPDSVCGVKNAEFGCVDSTDEQPGCGTFAGEQVCIDTNGEEIDSSSPDHPSNGGNGDGDETNDFEDPTDPTDPDAPACDPEVEECAQGKMIVDAIGEQTQALIDNDTLLQKENQQFIQDNVLGDYDQGSIDSLENAIAGSITADGNLVGQDDMASGQITALSDDDATTTSGLLESRAAFENRVSSALKLPDGQTCSTFTIPVTLISQDDTSWSIDCNDTQALRTFLEYFFNLVLVVGVFHRISTLGTGGV